MKIVAFSLFLLKITLADLIIMQKLLENITVPTFRSFTGFTVHILSNFHGYGCWCYFGTDGYGKGKSQPKDELDSLCKALHQGYECSIIDSIENGDSNCRSYDYSYTPISPSFDDEQITSACEIANLGTEEVR